MSAVSPRSAAEPMAFTRTEFLRGALRAWLWAIVLLIALWMAVYFPGGMISAIYVVPTSVAALAVFIAPAWWLGRSLRREPRVSLHVAAFAGLGALIGVITSLVFRTLTGDSGPFFDGFVAMFIAINAAGSAAAVALGWWGTARRALRPWSAVERDPDAAAEDALARGDAPHPPGPA